MRIGDHGRNGRGVGRAMVDAARHWARQPGAPGAFTGDVARGLYLAGWADALPGLGSLLAIFLVHGHRSLDLAAPGSAVRRADERILARLFDRVVGEGSVTAGEEDVLARWLSPRGVTLGLRVLQAMAETSASRTCRVALPAPWSARVLPFPASLAAE